MRILLTGAEGQLAQDLARVLAREDVVAVTHEQLEISDGAAVQALADQVRPECIINTAAFHDVNDCEDQAHKAFAVNGGGVAHLARATHRLNAVLVHFSTDYVFDGAKRSPYVESDPPGPLSAYAMSKLAGEWAVQNYCEKYFLVRPCGLYGLGGRTSRKGNFLETVLRPAVAGKPIRVVTDHIVTPTSTRELAERFLPLLRSGAYGLYHMTNTGECSWYEFAQEAFRQMGISCQITPTTGAEFGEKARRPPYSVLDNARLRAAGFPDFRPWQEALAHYLHERQNQNP